MSVTECDIQFWLSSRKSIQADVKRINQVLFWISPPTQNDFSSMMNLGFSFKDSPIRRLDRRTEVLGPALQPVWIQMEGIHLHAWDKSIFSRLGECLGLV